MNILKCACAKNWGDAAPLVLRVVTGLVFLLHGLQKVAVDGGVPLFGGFLGAVSVPAPLFFAWVIVLLEVVGGAAIILGFLTHWVSKFFMIEMLVAILLVHISKGFFVQTGGYELALLLFAATFSLVVTGAGKWSVDKWLVDSCCGKCEGGVCPEHGGEHQMK